MKKGSREELLNKVKTCVKAWKRESEKFQVRKSIQSGKSLECMGERVWEGETYTNIPEPDLGESCMPG